MLVYVLAAPLVCSAAVLIVGAIWRRPVEVTEQEVREADAFMRDRERRLAASRREWNEAIGIPAFGQKKAPAEARACESIEVAEVMLRRRRPR